MPFQAWSQFINVSDAWACVCADVWHQGLFNAALPLVTEGLLAKEKGCMTPKERAAARRAIQVRALPGGKACSTFSFLVSLSKRCAMCG
jgi:hypothetical protein